MFTLIDSLNLKMQLVPVGCLYCDHDILTMVYVVNEH